MQLMKFTITHFNERFPNEAACLAELKRLRYSDDYRCPKCDRNKWSQMKGRPAYACPCGHQIRPKAGTPFRGSPIPLKTWFYVIFELASSKNGVSALEIERKVDVSYPTALRMLRQLRKMTQDTDKLIGDVQVDESFFKPKPFRDSRVRPGGRWPGDGGQVLLGMAEHGGRVRVKHIPTVGILYIQAAIDESIMPGSHIHTDGASHYKLMNRRGYKHTAYQHYHTRVKWEPGRPTFKPVEGSSTQQIENFWGELKRGFYGVYRHASPKYFQLYADEYAFRYSNRKSDVPMFELLLQRI